MRWTRQPRVRGGIRIQRGGGDGENSRKVAVEFTVGWVAPDVATERTPWTRAESCLWGQIAMKALHPCAVSTVCALLLVSPFRTLPPPLGTPSAHALTARSSQGPAAVESVAEETYRLLDWHFLDRTAFDSLGPAARLQSLPPQSESEARSEAQSLVRALGDRYSKLLSVRSQPEPRTKDGIGSTPSRGCVLARSPRTCRRCCASMMAPGA